MMFVGTAPPREIDEVAHDDPAISVTGFVDDIRPYLNEAAVIVVPIRIGSGTRLKILDAMAMGKAVVSTSVGCEGLNVENGNNILIADSPSTFSNAVLDLLVKKEKRSVIERNARRTAKEYDWELLYKIQETVYQSALGS